MALKLRQPKGRSLRLAAFLALPSGLLLLSRFLSSSWKCTQPSRGTEVADDMFESSEPASELPTKSRPPEVRIFVYSLPAELEQSVVEDTRNDWGDYLADLWVYNSMQRSQRRTEDPESADLFFIPILPTRWFHARFEEQSYEANVAGSGDYVRRTIELISAKHPYWNRTNGRNHFMTLTHDHGRCTHFVTLNKAIIGDMFVLQHHGDLWAHVGGGENYAFPCYEPDRDVLLPAYMPSSTVPIVDPFAHDRPIKVLYRFRGDDIKDPYHGVLVRNKLWEHFQLDPPPGADWRVRNGAETLDDMAKAVFCVTPPGYVGYTGRYWRAIQRGCIPISFYRAYDVAFQEVLDYFQFTVNIQPNNLGDLTKIVKRLSVDPARLKELQRNLGEAQQQLSWDVTTPPSGVERLLYEMLDARAETISAMLAAK